MALEDYRKMLEDMVRDDSTTSQADQDLALEIGLLKYSKDVPRKITDPVTSDGTDLVDLPEGWQNDFSKLINVRVAEGQELVDFGEWQLVDVIGGQQVKVQYIQPPGGDVYITYTFPHELDYETTTVPKVDKIAVCYWAAAWLLDQLSTQYAGHQQTMLDADAVDWQSKSKDFAGRAKLHRSQYHEHLGTQQGKITASGVIVDLDQTDSRGRDRLIHKTRYR